MKMLEIEKYQYNQLINELEKNNYKLIFSYRIDAKKVLSYDDNNNIVLCLNGNNKFRKSNELCIHLPNNVYILNENNNYINQQNKNMYKINLKRKNTNYEIKIKGDLGTNLDLNKNNKNNKSNRYTDFYIVLNIFVIITFMFLFILILAYIQKRTKIEKGKYERETSSVIDPILAESIIDGKIDAKDLIMTCIVSLIYKKKIENIDNDSLKLIDTTDLSDIEREVLEIVYATPYPIENYRGQIAKISNINVIFKKENKKTQNIYQKFKIIKKIIKEQLFEIKILNNIWNFILMQVRALSCLVILNLMIIFGAGQENLFYSLNGTMLLLIISANVLIYIVSFDFGTTYILNARSTKHSGLLSITTIIIFINIIIGVISNLVYIDTELLLSFAVLIILNLVIFKLSNTYVLTKKGKEEYKKAYMLKKYLIDYSLIEQRDIDGLIIFDDYLIYATAFGIPSKITSKISEKLLNLNIKLQVISKILTL